MRARVTDGWRARLLALLAVLALAAAACGDDGADTVADDDAPEPAEETPAGDVETDDDAPATDDETDDTETDDSGTDDASAAGGSLPEGTYTIGFEALTSGPAAFAGVPLAQGARLAVQEINDTGFLGEGAVLEMSEVDAGGDPAQAIAAVNGFISQDVSGVLCCALSSAAGAVKPLLVDAETPGIVTSAILPGLPEPPYMYRPVLLLSEPAYEQLWEVVVEEFDGLETAVVGVTADNDGMVADGTVWASAAETVGVDVVATVDTNAGDTDFAGPATQVLNLDPDVFVNSLLGEEGTLFVKALRDRGYEGLILSNYGISNAANYEVGGEQLEGVLFPVAFTPTSENPVAQNFVELYNEAHGEDPDVFAAQGYTSVWLLAMGMAAAGDADSAAVGAALAEITEMDSVYGPIVYEDGQAVLVGQAAVMQWEADGSQTVFRAGD